MVSEVAFVEKDTFLALSQNSTDDPAILPTPKGKHLNYPKPASAEPSRKPASKVGAARNATEERFAELQPISESSRLPGSTNTPGNIVPVTFDWEYDDHVATGESVPKDDVGEDNPMPVPFDNGRNIETFPDLKQSSNVDTAQPATTHAESTRSASRVSSSSPPVISGHRASSQFIRQLHQDIKPLIDNTDKAVDNKYRGITNSIFGPFTISSRKGKVHLKKKPEEVIDSLHLQLEEASNTILLQDEVLSKWERFTKSQTTELASIKEREETQEQIIFNLKKDLAVVRATSESDKNTIQTLIGNVNSLTARLGEAKEKESALDQSKKDLEVADAGCARLSKDIKTLEEEKTRLLTGLFEAQKEREEFQARSLHLSKDIKELIDRNESGAIALADVRRELDASKASRADLMSRLEAAAAQITTLKHDQDIHVNTRTNLEAAETKIASLIEAIEDHVSRNKELSDKQDALLEELQLAKADLAIMNKRSIKHAATARDLEATNAKLTVLNGQSEVHVATLQELADTKAKLAELTKAHEDNISILSKAHKDAETYDLLVKSHEKTKSTLADTQAQVVALQKEIGEYADSQTALQGSCQT